MDDSIPAKKRILLLSAYHSASHRYWCEGLIAAFPEYQWTLKTQPARHFAWRVYASGWIWSLAQDPDFHQPYDLILATSLVDIVALKATIREFHQAPLWIYFHENQFAHPLGPNQRPEHQIRAQFKSLQNAFCADWITFNSRFNLETFFAGSRKLLRKFPEKLPGHPLQHLAHCSDVIPVPLNNTFRKLDSSPKIPGLIVWNHRWEWDKQPERFISALNALHHRGIDFKLAMLGIGGSSDHPLTQQTETIAPHILHWGQADPETYQRFISQASIGVSTALHDFQGLAVLELAQAGATVILPRRLAYPEVLPNAQFFSGSDQDPAKDIEELTETLASLLTQGPGSLKPAFHHSLPEWSTLRRTYQERIQTLLGAPLPPA